MKNGLLYSLITSVLFVTLEPVSKLIANDITPFAITFWRFFIGSFIMIPPALIKIRRDKIRISIRDIGVTALLGILFICISMLALQISVKTSDSPSLVAIIFSANSIFTILFAKIILKERFGKYKLIALAFGIIGLIVCADFSTGTSVASVCYAVFAALSFSLYTVLSQKYTKRISGIIQTCMVFISGSIVLLICLVIGRVDVMPQFSAYNIGILCYLGFLVTGVGYVCYFKAIEKGGSIMASVSFFLKPILTPFVTLYINGVIPDARIFLAVLLIILASFFSVYKGGKKQL